MDAIATLPFFALEIAKDGRIFSEQQQAAIRDAVGRSGAAKLTDLFVISHGWNNDMVEARELYARLFGNIAALMLGRTAASDRKCALVGVFWPSKKFADEELIPSGGAASIDDDGTGLTSSAVKAKLESLKGMFDAPDAAALDRAKALVDVLEDRPTKQKEFVDIIRSLLPQHPSDTADDACAVFLQRPGDEILNALAPPSMFSVLRAGNGVAATQGSTLDLDDGAGATAGLGDLFSGMKAAAWRLLNYATYYQMKERAGIVGKGLNGMLGAVRQLRPDLRLHLIGHSFGARVVTAAVDGATTFQPSSLCLLQGAFSHNGFTEKFDQHTDGFFRKVVSQFKVNGPIVATHTTNDLAVGVAYPIASRISSDNRSALGDENDVFGGIGRNGAVRMKPDECTQGLLLPETGPYQFIAKKVHNLRADQFISGHSDVTGRQVANAIVQAAWNGADA